MDRGFVCDATCRDSPARGASAAAPCAEPHGASNAEGTDLLPSFSHAANEFPKGTGECLS